MIDPYELGLDELVGRGMRWDELEAELCVRAARRLGATSLTVPGDAAAWASPTACAPRASRSSPTSASSSAGAAPRRAPEIAGVRRAQAAADAGMAAAAELLRDAAAAGRRAASRR